jgi:hypothetical protein
MREHGDNVVFVNPVSEEIVSAVRRQFGTRYPLSTIFGSGFAGKDIAEILSKKLPSTQKVLQYA